LTSGLLLGLDAAAIRIFYDEDHPGSRNRMLATWCVIATAFALPAAVAMIALSRAVSTYLFGTPEFATSVGAVGVVTLFGTYHHIALTILRALRRAKAFAIISASTLLLNGAFVIALVLSTDNAVTAVIAGFAASLFVTAIVGVMLVRPLIAARPTLSDAAVLFRLGLPLAPAAFATWGGEFANRAILLNSAGAAEVAHLAVALRIASVGGLIVGGFQLAWQPHSYAAGTAPAALAALAVDSRRILIAVAASIVALALVSPEVVQLAGGDAYVEALPVIGASLVGVFAMAMYVVTSTASALARRMGDLGIALVVGVAISILLNLLLARPYGAIGTATAMAIGPLSASFVVFALGASRVRIPIRWFSITPVLLILMSTTIIATAVPGGPAAWLRLLMGGACAVVLAREGTLRDAIRQLTRNNSKWRGRI
jgi:O-antigen/teichoic acid export membrane protein